MNPSLSLFRRCIYESRYERFIFRQVKEDANVVTLTDGGNLFMSPRAGTTTAAIQKPHTILFLEYLMLRFTIALVLHVHLPYVDIFACRGRA
jgi:hypothetical protein